MRDAALALDVGATKVAVGAVLRDGTVLSRVEVASSNTSRQDLNDSLTTAINQVLETPDIALVGAGIGSAGPIDHFKGTISPVNIAQWADFSLVDFVQDVSGIEKVRIVGDASALAFAEFSIGAGIGSTNLLGIVVSTGIGGGTVVGGRLHSGQYGNAGFIGHSIVVIDGDLCACGARGCIEAYCSGTNMAKNFGVATFEEVASAARNADARAKDVIDQGARFLAIGLVNAVALLDLDTIVIGGGVMSADDIYWPVLQSHFENEVRKLKFPGKVALKKATLGKDSGLVGAGLVGFTLREGQS